MDATLSPRRSRRNRVAASRKYPAREWLDQGLLRCVDCALAATLLVVPFLFGGRQAFGQLALVLLSLSAAFFWSLRQSLRPHATWNRSVVGPLFLTAVVLVSLQVVELPSGVLKTLSPHTQSLLPLWGGGESVAAEAGAETIGVWKTLSLTPNATRECLTLLLAGGLLLLVVIQRVQRREDVHFLLSCVAASACIMAGFGLIQYVTSNGKFFWFYEHPFTDTARYVKGAFTNRNHFANFVAMGLGPIVWLLFYVKGRKRSSAKAMFGFAPQRNRIDTTTGPVALAAGTCVFAVLMSLSRGGTMALVAAGLTCLLLLYLSSMLRWRSMLAVGGLGLAIGLGLCIHGFDMVATRLDEFRSIEKLRGIEGLRPRLWAADAQGIRDHLLTGTGAGSHAQVHPVYLDLPSEEGHIYFTHAENGPIQAALEMGVPGLLLVLTAFGFCFYWCVAAFRTTDSSTTRLCLVAILPCFVASVVHSAVDFVWYVPGCMVVVVVMAGCACRLWQLERERQGRNARSVAVPRIGWMAGALLVLVMGIPMVQDRVAATKAEGHWYAFKRTVQDLEQAKAEDERLALFASMLNDLHAAVKYQPRHAEAHAALAASHLDVFHELQRGSPNAFHLRDIRDVFQQTVSDPDSSRDEAMAWVDRAVGSHVVHLRYSLRHAKRAVSLCPLQGDAYIHLAELAFLDDEKQIGMKSYLEQAYAVRPHDGYVLMEIGKEAALAGDDAAAMRYWRAAFAKGSIHQRQVMEILSQLRDPKWMVENFRPDCAALHVMRDHYARIQHADQLAEIRPYWAAACETEARQATGAEAVQYWQYAAYAYAKIEAYDDQIRCLEGALRSDSGDFAVRLKLGQRLQLLGRLTEAEEQFRRCRQLKPNHVGLQTILRATIEERLKAEAAARNLPGSTVGDDAPRVSDRPTDFQRH